MRRSKTTIIYLNLHKIWFNKIDFSILTLYQLYYKKKIMYLPMTES